MIDKTYIDYIKNKLNEFEEKKDKLINYGIKLNRLSKSTIYSIIRGDIEKAKDYIVEMKKYKEEIERIIREEPSLYNNALVNFQEYAEAIIFYYF
ncbi:MAG: haloacid dehalogenase, partial [Nanopusillaceae archaeon]